MIFPPITASESSNQDSGFSFPSQVETQFPTQATPLTQELIQTQSEAVPSQPSQPEIDPTIAKCTQGDKKELVPEGALLESNPSQPITNGQTEKTIHDPTILNGIAVVDKGNILPQNASGETLVIDPQLCVIDEKTGLVQFRPLKEITTINDDGTPKTNYEWQVPGRLYPEYPLVRTSTIKENLVQPGDKYEGTINNTPVSFRWYIDVSNVITRPDGTEVTGQIIGIQKYNPDGTYINTTIVLRIPTEDLSGYEDIPMFINPESHIPYFVFPKPLSFPKNPGH